MTHLLYIVLLLTSTSFEPSSSCGLRLSWSGKANTYCKGRSCEFREDDKETKYLTFHRNVHTENLAPHILLELQSPRKGRGCETVGEPRLEENLDAGRTFHEISCPIALSCVNHRSCWKTGNFLWIQIFWEELLNRLRHAIGTHILLRKSITIQSSQKYLFFISLSTIRL